jgi:hypothetical protein
MLVLGVVYRTIARHLIGQAGLTHSRTATGAVTVIQQCGCNRSIIARIEQPERIARIIANRRTYASSP